VNRLNINANAQIYSYFKKIVMLVVGSMILWVVAVVGFYEYQSTLKVKELLMQEQSRAKLLFGKEEFDTTFDKEGIKNLMEQNNVLAVEIKNDNGILFKLQSDALSEKFNYIFNKNIITEIKDAVLIPINNQEACLLFAYEHGGHHFKVLVQLNSNEVAGIKNKIYEVVFVAIFSILVTCLISFPLIYRQYKQILGNNQELRESNLGIIKALGNAVAKRDSDTHEHNYRVTYYAVKLGEALGVQPKEMDNLAKGAFLHDVGKIGIPDSILLKPAKLSEDEFEVMKNHVVYGKEIIEGIDWLKGTDLVVNYHHEKFDGSGYPHKLKGEQIPIEARAFAVVDVFDALMSVRPYKRAMEYEESIEIIIKSSGAHFDPKVVNVFLSISKELLNDINGKNPHEIEVLLMGLLKNYY
jgi:HD-GYP domain-containing protein (c-di-GMP phosphodiesterase class II)